MLAASLALQRRLTRTRDRSSGLSARACVSLRRIRRTCSTTTCRRRSSCRYTPFAMMHDCVCVPLFQHLHTSMELWGQLVPLPSDQLYDADLCTCLFSDRHRAFSHADSVRSANYRDTTANQFCTRRTTVRRCRDTCTCAIAAAGPEARAADRGVAAAAHLPVRNRPPPRAEVRGVRRQRRTERDAGWHLASANIITSS